MSKNEFDELLLKKLQEEDLPYNPEHWDHLSQLLPPSLAPAANRGRKWLIATGIAAAAAFILAGVFYVQLMDKNQDAFPVQEPAVAQKQTTAPDATATRTVPAQLPSEQEQQVMPVVPQNSQVPGPATANNSSYNKQITPYKPAPVVPGSTTREEQQPREAVVRETPKEQIVPQSPLPEEHKENAGIAKNKENRMNLPVYPDHFDNRDPVFTGGASKNNKTSVSLGGGVNYGNLNTGYTVGVSARTKITGNFFVDGTVAMMYNNNANNVVNYNGASTVANLAAKPAGQLPGSPAVEPTQSLYYVQFNPSIGYQIDKNVALSVGSDFQQMLSRTDGAEKVQLAADNTKIFPAFDIGLTTKSEFNITPNIQAGLMYREGLSNLLKNDGNKYVNRRYFQVQFKYNIPVN